MVETKLNEIVYLNIVSSFKLVETFTNSLPSRTFTAYEVYFLVFSATALSTSRYISSSVTKANHSPILTLILINCKLEALKFLKSWNIDHLRNITGIFHSFSRGILMHVS